MANKLYINGVDVTDDVKDFDSFEIQIGLNPSTKTITKILSQPVRVTGDTFKHLESVFFSTCNSYDKKQQARFKTDLCGGIAVNLEITMEGLGYYPDIEEIEILLKSVNDVDAAYDKLDSSYWWENGFVTTNDIPIMYFGLQPGYYQYMVLLLTIQLKMLVKFIDILWYWLRALLQFVLNKDLPSLSTLIFGALDNWLTGLGRWSTAPLIREILEFQANAAGLQFSSSILNDPGSPYYSMSLFSLEMGKAGSYKDTSTEERRNVLLENAPLWSVIELLGNLESVFEAEYRIIGKTLYFEHTEFFDNLANIRLFHTKDKCTDPLRYEYKIDELVAWGDFRFNMDATDAEGAKSKKYYEQKLDFNDPYSSAQKGKLSRNHSFGPCRFMFDPYGFNNNGIFDEENHVDIYRMGSLAFDGGSGSDFAELFSPNTGVMRESDLLITSKYLSYPKLIVLEANFSRNDAKAIKKEYGKRGIYRYWLYNYPLLYKETTDQVNGDELIEGTEGALTGFAKLADPRLKKDKMYVNSIEIECDCNVVTNSVSNFQQVYIQTAKGKGIPESIKLKFDESNVMIELSNIRVLCE